MGPLMKMMRSKWMLAGTLSVVMLAGQGFRAPDPDPVAVVRVEAGRFAHRASGDFTRAGRQVDGPVRETRIARPFAMMKNHVTAADYDRCVAAGACAPRGDADRAGRPDRPVIGVSHLDATAYARWFAARTGRPWRLPTDAEWAFAAGSKFTGEPSTEATGTGFAERWIARYEREAEASAAVETALRPLGGFGANERGLDDLDGNVWEWTDSCFVRQALDTKGRAIGPGTVNCGVRVVEGRHRTYVTDFIRDARAGGCAAGVPPTHLGFRLVRDEPDLVARIEERVRRSFGRVAGL